MHPNQQADTDTERKATEATQTGDDTTAQEDRHLSDDAGEDTSSDTDTDTDTDVSDEGSDDPDETEDEAEEGEDEDGE